ncbi:hypothetical protein RB201_04380 [Streptomyces sp. S1A(2023)]
MNVPENTLNNPEVSFATLVAAYMPRVIVVFGLLADSYDSMPPAEGFERALEDAAETLDEEELDSQNLMATAGSIDRAVRNDETGERYRMHIRHTLDEILAAREQA